MGLAFGIASVLWLGFIFNDTVIEISLTLAVSYIAFFTVSLLFFLQLLLRYFLYDFWSLILVYVMNYGYLKIGFSWTLYDYKAKQLLFNCFTVLLMLQAQDAADVSGVLTVMTLGMLVLFLALICCHRKIF